MAFDKNILKRANLELKPQQPNLAKSGLNSVFQQEVPQKPKNQFQTLIEKTPVAIFVIQEQICYANPAAELIMDCSRSQSSSDLDFYHQLNPNGYKLGSLEQDYVDELKIGLKDGRERWFECWWEKIEWECQPAFIVTAIDITKYQQQEAKIQQALSVEKELCKDKARFVSMVSHEFRTPLNIISFSTSLLKRHFNKWNQTKQLKYLDRLQNAVEQLSDLMDEILIIGRAEAGKLKFNPQRLDLNSFCQNLLKEINLSQAKPEINYVNKIERETVLADKNLLKLVLVNLLGNAIKYSPTDSVVKFTVSGDNEIVFQVADCGIGIPLEEQSRIFEPFHRSTNTGDLPGNGLGLAIAKKIVELQGGQILVESEVNIGSTFTVKIPLKV